MGKNVSSVALYDPSAAHAGCGVGVIVDLNGGKSHRLVEDGFTALLNLDHRSARGAEEKTGDGAGMLLQKPHEFFASQIFGLPEFDRYGVGQAFFPREKARQAALRRLIEDAARDEGFEVFAWRDVPTDHSDLGKTALESEPKVVQFFVAPLGGPLPRPLSPRERGVFPPIPRPLSPGERGVRPSCSPEEIDTRLYVLRRVIENSARAREEAARHRFYICSLDRRKIVYKGLLTCAQLKRYYPDLSDARVKSALVLVHSRFSTNTLGAWELAHPYRCLVHNGEINTLRGNKNWMKTREATLACSRFGDDIHKLKPVTSEGLSDSAVFDNVLELLMEAGRSLPHALRMMIPEAWSKDPFMDPRRRAFYDYHSTLMEPWDGPALVAATDGYRVAAVLDRNGLRPCRIWVTRDGRLIMGSETGILDVPASEIVYKGRLRPGQLFLADTLQKRIVPEQEIFDALAAPPYDEWLESRRVKLSERVSALPADPGPAETQIELARCQRAFGYTLESLRCLVQPMAENAKDPIGSMGNDAPLAALSSRNRPLFHYFSQMFAQVSNPPIDYLREDLVTSLVSHIGHQRNLLDATPEHCRQLRLESPILTGPEIEAILRLDHNGIRSCRLEITYARGTALAEAIEALRMEVEQAVGNGCEILVLSDRGTGPERIPIPSLLAIGAVHHHLIRRGLRTRAGIVLDTGHPCAVHDFCTLIGYGADAIHPWLAYESISEQVAEGFVSGDEAAAKHRYKNALEDGILKVMSKMGISTLESYKGAQVFEAVGLNPDFVEDYFAGTTCPVPGIGLAEIEREVLENHAAAFGEKIAGNLELELGGELYWRRDGEMHQWNPYTIGKLQHATRTGDYAAYREFAAYVNEQDGRLQTLRGLLDFVIEPGQSIPLEEVESVEAVMKRFSTGSMSFGALSREAHETLAVAMNRIGAKSGTGEGGEQMERFGTERECSMKQVASGRFGVTIDYLAHARQIEIKMAQGSKPGEGGELPGGKVDEGIAAVRFTTPGVGLISPPPHHDIYSIEDLAQLIYDLKCANPEAEIHVKLVAVAGVGTIAAGVAKARADAVLISGDAGGTGASLKTSIKSAGSAWELGLAQTQQVLLANNLRSRIKVRADGGFKTGRDVAVAALLGAEEYGFGTSPLVALGCIMLRKCHCNTCSVGIATQNPDLRKKFAGQPEYVVNYMHFIAQEVREIMAALGFRTLDEMIGRVDKLRQKDTAHPKGIRLDLARLLHRQPSSDAPRKTRDQDHKLAAAVDHRLIRQARAALEEGQPLSLELAVRNRDRAVGTLLSGTVTRKYGARGLPADTLVIRCSGSAGQSFGAFLAPGITLHLTGDANDYVGKGLSGGKITLTTPREAGFAAAGNIVVGNVALYGATAGEAYFNGMAGERFAVRNSGAMAVVEGVGDHACEYMTGGVVVVLGGTGKNFGAGMSGGEAFVLDEAGDFENYLNRETVELEPLDAERDHCLLKRLLENHAAYTGSVKARRILEEWRRYAGRFVKVMPRAYADVVRKSMSQGRDVRVAPPPRARETIAA